MFSLAAAPNVYHIPSVLGKTMEGDKKTAPAFSISGRQKDLHDDKALIPGPGAYDPSNADCYNQHQRSPAFSISSRHPIPSDSTQKPGPGAHSPEKVRLYNEIVHKRRKQTAVYVSSYFLTRALKS